MCRVLSDVRSKLLDVFLSVGEAKESGEKKGYICSFPVASCQAGLVLLDLRKGQFVVLCILLSFFFPRRR